MIVAFNKGLQNEVNYDVDSCGNLLNFIPDEDRSISFKEEITLNKQITANDPNITAKTVFSDLLKPDYVIYTITIFNNFNEILLQAEDFQLTTCTTRLGYTDRGEVGKFANLTFTKN